MALALFWTLALQNDPFMKSWSKSRRVLTPLSAPVTRNTLGGYDGAVLLNTPCLGWWSEEPIIFTPSLARTEAGGRADLFHKVRK